MLGLRLGWRQRGNLPIQELGLTWSRSPSSEAWKVNQKGASRPQVGQRGGSYPLILSWLQPREGPSLPQGLIFGIRDASQTGSSHCFLPLLILSLCHLMSPSPTPVFMPLHRLFLCSIGNTLSLLYFSKSFLSRSRKNLPPLGSPSVAAFPGFTPPSCSPTRPCWHWLAREVSGPGPAFCSAVCDRGSGTRFSKLSEVLSRQFCSRGPSGNVGFSTTSLPELLLSSGLSLPLD